MVHEVVLGVRKEWNEGGGNAPIVQRFEQPIQERSGCCSEGTGGCECDKFREIAILDSCEHRASFGALCWKARPSNQV